VNQKADLCYRLGICHALPEATIGEAISVSRVTVSTQQRAAVEFQATAVHPTVLLIADQVQVLSCPGVSVEDLLDDVELRELVLDIVLVDTESAYVEHSCLY
jgi:hypothetical protein